MKWKIAYLLSVIIFLSMAFLYLLDKWQVLVFESYLPGLDQEIPLLENDGVNESANIKWDEIRKSQERLEEENQALASKFQEIKEKETEIREQNKQLAIQRKEIAEERKKLEKAKEQFTQIKIKQKQIVDKIIGVEPNEAARILQVMPDQEVYQILSKIDEQAEQSGTRSVSSYLLSLLPTEKSGKIISLMLKNQTDPSQKENTLPDNAQQE